MTCATSGWAKCQEKFHCPQPVFWFLKKSKNARRVGTWILENDRNFGSASHFGRDFLEFSRTAKPHLKHQGTPTNRSKQYPKRRVYEDGRSDFRREGQIFISEKHAHYPLVNSPKRSPRFFGNFPRVIFQKRGWGYISAKPEKVREMRRGRGSDQESEARKGFG